MSSNNLALTHKRQKYSFCADITHWVGKLHLLTLFYIFNQGVFFFLLH